MKNLFPITLALAISAVAYGDSTSRTKTTTIKETSTSSPAMSSEVGSDAEMLEAEEYDESLDDDAVNEERMEEKDDSFIKSEEEVDYKDRTRTNRERKAINTGSDASDDQ